MRRSFRDAIVGFSILGGVILFGGISFWLRGIRLVSNNWQITANFSDASGLAERSPVTYRGIMVGSVKKIFFTPENVKAELTIDNTNLRLPKPVMAKVVKSSFLGGDVQIALISRGKYVESDKTLPTSQNCNLSKIICENDEIEGESLISLSKLTEELENILKQADKKEIVTSLADSIKQFDQTQENLDELILLSKSEIDRAEPIITGLIEAANHINNILSSINNPSTLNDLRETASSTRSLTKRIDDIGGDMEKVMEDEELMSALRSLTIGLGKLFDELYE